MLEDCYITWKQRWVYRVYKKSANLEQFIFLQLFFFNQNKNLENETWNDKGW